MLTGQLLGTLAMHRETKQRGPALATYVLPWCIMKSCLTMPSQQSCCTNSQRTWEREYGLNATRLRRYLARTLTDQHIRIALKVITQMRQAVQVCTA